jgi:hypothetical protein
MELSGIGVRGEVSQVMRAVPSLVASRRTRVKVALWTG